MIEIVAETRSTNDDLAARIAAGERVGEGAWLVADRQTAGRGRLGRGWSDGIGNFMGSTSICVLPQDPPATTLALVAGLAVQASVSSHIPPPGRALLKWPNDVLVAGAKLAGILLERAGDHVIIGIGVNLAQAPRLERDAKKGEPVFRLKSRENKDSLAGRETGALADYGPAPDRDIFAAALAAHFAEEVQRWRSYGLGPLIARWQAAAHPPGTPLSVSQADGSRLPGVFAGLAEDGALRLALPDGTTRIIHAGEVLLA